MAYKRKVSASDLRQLAGEFDELRHELDEVASAMGDRTAELMLGTARGFLDRVRQNVLRATADARIQLRLRTA